MDSDRAIISKLYAESAKALDAKDIDKLTGIYRIDAIQLPPDAPALEGWSAIQASLESGLKGIQTQTNIDVDEILVDGSLACARGTYVTVVVRTGSDAGTRSQGAWLDVLTKEPNGGWKILRSTWSVYR